MSRFFAVVMALSLVAGAADARGYHHHFGHHHHHRMWRHHQRH